MRRVATAMSPFLRAHLIIVGPKPVEAQVTSGFNQGFNVYQVEDERRYSLNQSLGETIVEEIESKSNNRGARG